MSPAAPDPVAEAAPDAASSALVRCQDALEFKVRAGEFLMRDEATNCLMISIAMRLAAAPERGEHYMSVVQQQDQTVAAALRDSGHKLIISRGSDAVLRAMARDWPQDGSNLTHAAGPAPDIERFADHYRAWTGRKARRGMAQRLYEAHTVENRRRAAGVMRLASEADLPQVKGWLSGYTSETQGPSIAIERHIAAQRLHLWVNNGVVAMASVSGLTPNSARLSLVYTPPAQRGQGYAQALVTALANKMMEKLRFCTLFTDIDNPVSNAVYRKVGFTPVCDFHDMHFF